MQDDPSDYNFCRLLSFPLVLRRPSLPRSFSKRTRNRSTSTTILHALPLWSSDPTLLLRRALELEPPNKQQAPSPPQEAPSKAAKIKIAHGRLGLTLRTLLSSGVAPHSDATLQTLRALHPRPASEDPLPPPPHLPSAPRLTDNDVEKAIHAFPSGSAAGLDSLRPQHLLDLLRGPACYLRHHLLEALRRFTQLFLDGRCPDPVAPYISAASITRCSRSPGVSALLPLASSGAGWRPDSHYGLPSPTSRTTLPKAAS